MYNLPGDLTPEQYDAAAAQILVGEFAALLSAMAKTGGKILDHPELQPLINALLQKYPVEREGYLVKFFLFFTAGFERGIEYSERQAK